MSETKKRRAGLESVSPVVPVQTTYYVPERDVDKSPILQCINLGISFGGLKAVDVSDTYSQDSGVADTGAATKEQAVYMVRKGDTLWGIAKRYGVALTALIAANPQIKNPNLIYPGDRVNIP